MRGRLILAVLAVLLASCATQPASKRTRASAPVSATNTAGALIVLVDEVPEVVVFVSKNGQIAEYAARDCAASKGCMALLKAEDAAGHLDTVDIVRPQGDAPSTHSEQNPT